MLSYEYKTFNYKRPNTENSHCLLETLGDCQLGSFTSVYCLKCPTKVLLPLNWGATARLDFRWPTSPGESCSRPIQMILIWSSASLSNLTLIFERWEEVAVKKGQEPGCSWEVSPRSRYEGRMATPKLINFRKSSKWGGGGFFSTQIFILQILDLKQDFLNMKISGGGQEIFVSGLQIPNVMVYYKTFGLKHYIVFLKKMPPTGQNTFWPTPFKIEISKLFYYRLVGCLSRGIDGTCSKTLL